MSVFTILHATVMSILKFRVHLPDISRSFREHSNFI